MRKILRTLEEFFWDIYFTNEFTGTVIAILIGSIPVYLIVRIFRYFDKDYKKEVSIEEQIKNIEDKLSQHEEELQHLLPKIEPLEKEEIETRYDSKKNNKILYELSLIKRRINALELFIKEDKEKLLELKNKE